MKFYLEKDVWWPYIIINTKDKGIGYTDGVVDLTDNELIEYKKVLADFKSWQKRLQKACEN